MERIREVVGDDFPVIYRISLLDLVEGGQTWDETVELAQRLRDGRRHRVQHRHRLARGAGADDHHPGPARGLDAVDGAAARGRSTSRSSPPTGSTPPSWPSGCWPTAPADLVSMARPFLADPDFVAQGRRRGAPTRSTPASRCNQACLDHTFAQPDRLLPGQPARLPRDLAGARPDPAVARRVAVVGAGPAGLAAAVSAAERGFAVTLFEAAPELGGQFRLAMAVPGKEDFADTLRYYARRLEVLGVDVRLVDAGDRGRPRVVRRGRGRDRRRAADPGDRRASTTRASCRTPTCSPGASCPASRVAVIGAGGIGVDVAHWLDPRPGRHRRGLARALGRRRPGGPPRRADRAEAAHADPRGDPGAAQDDPDRRSASARPRAGRTARCCKQSGVRQVVGRDVRPDRRRRPPPDRRRACRWWSSATTSWCVPARSRCGRCTTSWSRAGVSPTSSAVPTSPPSSTPSARSTRAPGWPPLCRLGQVIRDLTDDELRRALVLKWGAVDPDVLPAWVAEMDYATRAGRWPRPCSGAVADGVLGYPPFDGGGGAVGEAYAGFARRHYGQAGRPRAGAADGRRDRRGPGRARRAERAGPGGAADARPTTRSSASSRCTGRELWELPLAPGRRVGAMLDLDRLDDLFAAARRTLLLTQPHNPLGHVYTRAELEGIRDVARPPRRPRHQRRDPRAAGAARRRARPLPVAATAPPTTRSRWSRPARPSTPPACAAPRSSPPTRPPATGCSTSRWPATTRGRRSARSRRSRRTPRATPGWRRWSSRLDEQRTLLAELLAEHLPEARMRPLEATYLAWLDLRAYGHDDPAAVALEKGRVQLEAGPPLPAGPRRPRPRSTWPPRPTGSPRSCAGSPPPLG